jgi:hypothetical protein
VPLEATKQISLRCAGVGLNELHRPGLQVVTALPACVPVHGRRHRQAEGARLAQYFSIFIEGHSGYVFAVSFAGAYTGQKKKVAYAACVWVLAYG